MFKVGVRPKREILFIGLWAGTDYICKIVYKY